MPYSGPGDESLPANVLRLSSKRQRQWISVYDSARERGFDEGRAIKVANGVVKKQAGQPAGGARAMDAALVSPGLDVDEWMETQLIADWPDADCEFIGPASVAPVSPREAIPPSVAQPPVGPAAASRSSSPAGGNRFVGEYGYEAPQLSWKEAGYDAYGASGGEGCATCRWFEAYGSCRIVRGTIVPTGKSKYYMASADAVEAGVQSTGVAPAAVVASREGDVGRIPLVDRFMAWLGGEDGGAAQLGTEGLGGAGTQMALREQPDGRLRFFTFASNNYEDRGKLIFVESGQREYESWVQRTGHYPELWLWHTRGSKFGEGDRLWFDGHVQVTTGLIDVGKEGLARALAEAGARGELGMSHGYIGHHRDMPDGTVEVLQFREFEQSVLPLQAAANYGTYFGLLGGNQEVKLAKFAQEQRDWLHNQCGVSHEEIDNMERLTTDMQTKFEAVGINWRSLEMAEGAPGAGVGGSSPAPNGSGAPAGSGGDGVAAAPVGSAAPVATGVAQGSSPQGSAPATGAAAPQITDGDVRRIVGEEIAPLTGEIRALTGGLREFTEKFSGGADAFFGNQWEARARTMPRGFEASKSGAAPTASQRDAAVTPGANPPVENPLKWTDDIFNGSGIPALSAPAVNGQNGRVS